MSSTRALRPNAAASLLSRLQRLAATDQASTDLACLLLAPLAREDAERGNNLLETLRAYYECGTRVDWTADRLFLHRNSVRYRLDRVRSLLGMNIDEPQAIAALVLALGCSNRTAEQADAG